MWMSRFSANWIAFGKKSATLAFDASANGRNNYCSGSFGWGVLYGWGKWSRMSGLTIEPHRRQTSCAQAAPLFLILNVTVPAVKTLCRTAGQLGVMVWHHCVIHCAAANLSIELISTYAVSEFSREGIFCYVYIATHLHPSCAVNTPHSAIISTKGVALQAITTQKIRQMQRLG